MTLEDINMMQAALEKKKQQEIMRKEYKQRHAMQDIKDIFLDAFMYETKDIMEQQSNIVEQIKNANLDTNVKLMEWLERKFQGKVNENISSEIALSQVELANKIDRVTDVIGNILSLYTKLYNMTLFTHEVGQQILRLEDQLKLSSQKLSQNPVQTEQHFSLPATY